MSLDYAITFATYNSSHYTKACINSLIQVGTPLDRIVVVDNGSTDDTREYLLELPLGGRIFNKGNQGCGVAWNQGILHLQAEWTVVMNNDLIVSPEWIERLIQTAINNKLKIISPARIDGDLDYDFDVFARNSTIKMMGVLRKQSYHAICMCIHRSVFQEVGYFRATPKLLGFEDFLFFHDVQKARITSAITGDVWLHHFGSVTQKEMKKKLGKSESDDLTTVNHNHLLGQSWLDRKISKYQMNKQTAAWKQSELEQYEMTLQGERLNQTFIWH